PRRVQPVGRKRISCGPCSRTHRHVYRSMGTIARSPRHVPPLLLRGFAIARRPSCLAWIHSRSHAPLNKIGPDGPPGLGEPPFGSRVIARTGADSGVAFCGKGSVIVPSFATRPRERGAPSF